MWIQYKIKKESCMYMKKKSLMAANVLLAAALLCGCAPQAGKTDAPSQTTAVTEAAQPTADAAASAFSWQDTPTHNAFRRTLKTIHDTLRLPAITNMDRISLWEPGTIEDETFAVTDVDGDGEEELLVGISNTTMAGMCKVVYGYDEEKDDVREEALTWFSATFYPEMIRIEASHNHGYAGDVLWPYTVKRYDREKDAYQDTYYVDAWSRELAEYDSLLERDYPEEIDTENEGFVYLITENGETKILNRRDFEKWESALFAGLEPLEINWMKMTPENIGLQ